MPDQTIPPNMLRYLEAQAQGRLDRAIEALDSLPIIEANMLREVAVMAWVRGAMSVSVDDISGSIPKTTEIMTEVLNCCDAMSDMYPTITALMRGQLPSTRTDPEESTS